MKYERMNITLEQQKVISSPIRSRILFHLYKQPMTAKQLADEMEKSPGNVHYHVKQLYKHGLIKLIEEKIVNGIIEKYYQAPTLRFEVDSEDEETSDLEKFVSEGHIYLTEEEKSQLQREITMLTDKYLDRLCEKTDLKKEVLKPYKFSTRLTEVLEEE